MQRNFVRGLLICLIPCLLAGLFAVRLDKYRLGIDLAGGTILVYEINLDRLKARKAQSREGGDPGASNLNNAGEDGLDSEEMNKLASQIKRRIDPTDIKNVTVRPLGRSRFEIILPFSGATSGKENLTAEEIEDVKRLISQMGVLEFRILANGTDDNAGMKAARDAIKKSAADLPARAVAGLPPEGPADEFDVNLGESKAKVRYVWVELGPEEREHYGLNNRQEASGLWQSAKLARNTAFGVRSGGSGYMTTPDTEAATVFLFSRDVTSRDTLAKESADRDRLKREGKTDEEIKELVNEKKVEYFILTRISPEDSLKVVGDVTLTASVGVDKKSDPSVDFRFNGAGAQQFGKMTRRNIKSNSVKRQLAIILDDRVVSAPGLESEITSQGQITGNFDRKKVENLVQILRSGALSAELKEKPVSENTIGPTLGKDTIQKGTLAVGLAFAAILLFMLVYYQFAGLVACIALFANLLLTVGFMVAVNAAFTLPGLAGLVLTLGMAVDANVLIYERLREERNKGANIVTAIRNGYDRAFPTIIDTHLTSIFTAIVLYSAGNDNLKGFAISLTVGLIISLFTSLYMTRLMFDFWLSRKWLTELRMLRLFEKPSFRPMKYRYVFFTITGVLTVAGLALFLLRGESVLNVDFRGGTVFAGRLKDGEERSLTAANGQSGFRELLGEANQKAQLTATEAKRLPDSDSTTSTYVYTITYAADGKKTTSKVTLHEKPLGDTPEEMEADVVRRASHLPDVSVEQMFLTGEPNFGDGRSRYFTIRTTERQPGLVRLTLDRLLRGDNGQSLMAGATMSYPTAVVKMKDASGKETDQAVPVVAGGAVEVTFTQPASPNYLRELLEQEFWEANRRKPEKDAFTVDGVGEGAEGRFTKLSVKLKNDQLPSAAADVATRDARLLVLNTVFSQAKQAFDAAPEPARLEVFDSQLARETRSRAFWAIALSWIAILLYLWFRFGNWTFGLAAVICLIHDLCFTLGAIAVCHYLFALPGMNILGIEDFKIDLATIAALLTLVGYSVSDTIVVFDRIREVRGKNPRLTSDMINDSVNQTLSRTILTAATVFLVSIVLYAAGGEGVHLFAFVMVMGVMVGTYSSVFVAAPLLLLFGEGHNERLEAAAAEEAAEKEAHKGEVVEG